MPGPGELPKLDTLTPRLFKALDRVPAAPAAPQPDGLIARDELAPLTTPTPDGPYAVPATYPVRPGAAPDWFARAAHGPGGTLTPADMRALVAKLPPAKRADVEAKLAGLETAIATLSEHHVAPEQAVAFRAEAQAAVAKLQAQIAQGGPEPDPEKAEALLGLLDACTAYVETHDDLAHALAD